MQIPGQSTQTFSGTAFVVTQDASPFGAGWTFGPTDRLVSIAAWAAPGGDAARLRRGRIQLLHRTRLANHVEHEAVQGASAR